jgi:hypothetical protein
MTGARGRKLAVLTAAIVMGLTGTSVAHRPHTDGGPADRGCAPVFGGATYVGATEVSCRIVRKVVRGTLNGRTFRRWACAEPAMSFGHCHGRGTRRGGMVHWAVND